MEGHSGEPRRFPCPPQGSPKKDCQIGLVSCQACQGQLPTGVPADCQSGEARGQQGAANRLSPHRPTVSQERPKAPSGNAGRPVRHGPGTSRGVRQWSFCRSLLWLPSILSPFFCPGHPTGLLGTHPIATLRPLGSIGLIPFQAARTDSMTRVWPTRALHSSGSCDWITMDR